MVYGESLAGFVEVITMIGTVCDAAMTVYGTSNV